jgi:hypothetical protein
LRTSFARYIDNPGIIKGSSTNSMIKLVKADYRRRFDALYVREGGLIVYKLFKDKNNTYYIYIKMPSETAKNLYYDVVIELSASTLKALVADLNRYDVKFFSNDPAFVFTYAYSFKKAGLLIDWLEKKLSKQAITQKPIIRNPKHETGYVKSLYFAYFLMETKKLFNLDNWKEAKELNKRDLLNEISDFLTKTEDGVKLRKLQKEKEKLKKQLEEDKKLKNKPSYISDNMRIAKNSHTISGVDKSKTARIVSTVKRARTVKKK